MNNCLTCKWEPEWRIDLDVRHGECKWIQEKVIPTGTVNEIIYIFVLSGKYNGCPAWEKR